MKKKIILSSLAACALCYVSGAFGMENTVEDRIAKMRNKMEEIFKADNRNAYQDYEKIYNEFREMYNENCYGTINSNLFDNSSLREKLKSAKEDKDAVFKEELKKNIDIAEEQLKKQQAIKDEKALKEEESNEEEIGEENKKKIDMQPLWNMLKKIDSMKDEEVGKKSNNIYNKFKLTWESISKYSSSVFFNTVVFLDGVTNEQKGRWIKKDIRYSIELLERSNKDNEKYKNEKKDELIGDRVIKECWELYDLIDKDFRLNNSNIIPDGFMKECQSFVDDFFAFFCDLNSEDNIEDPFLPICNDMKLLDHCDLQTRKHFFKVEIQNAIRILEIKKLEMMRSVKEKSKEDNIAVEKNAEKAIKGNEKNLKEEDSKEELEKLNKK